MKNIIDRCGCVPSGDLLSLRDALIFRNQSRQRGEDYDICYRTDNGRLAVLTETIGVLFDTWLATEVSLL